MKSLFILLLAAALMPAQLRIPGRSTQRQQEEKNPLDKIVNITGVVQNAEENSLVVEGSDTRFLTFKINSTTKFNDGLKLSTLKQGDPVRVEAKQDSEAYLTATAVFKAEAKDVSEAATQRAIQNTVQGKPVADPDDGGPPRLKRGKPPETQAAAVDPPQAPPPDSRLTIATSEAVESKPAPTNSKQELLERAREWALSFTETLPNYVCQQFTTRYIRAPGTSGWQAKDVVSANVVYENGKEDYRNIAINGKQINKKMEEMPGSWSTGEFGTTLRSLFHPARRAEFTFVKQSQMNGLTAMVYDYTVKREYSDWRVMLGSQSIIPAYNGRVWIDNKSGKVLRIEMSAIEIPEEFPLDKVESASDYNLVRLATSDQYMLPVHAETLSCERGSPVCSRNAIDFRNYHKYSGETNIIFDK